MKVEVKIKLRSGILDPQGKAIHHALSSLGYNNISGVSVGKVINLDIDGTDKESIKRDVIAMCDSLLANTVVEDYEIII